MFSDPASPSDGTEGAKPQSYYEYQKEKMQNVTDEDWDTFSKNVMNRNNSDPAAKQFFDGMLNTITTEMNREMRRAKEATRKLKDAFEDNDT